jgi:hypothetical protein
MAYRKGVRRLKPAPLNEDTASIPPLDTTDPWPKKKLNIFDRFEAVIDPAIPLSDEAIRRIDRSIRQAVLGEVALLDVQGDLVIRFGDRDRKEVLVVGVHALPGTRPDTPVKPGKGWAR